MNQLWSLRGHLNPISTIVQNDLATSNEQDYLITTDEQGWIIIWNVSLRKPKYVWKGHDKLILSCKVIEQHFLLTHSKDSEIKIWNISSASLDHNKVSSTLPAMTFNEMSYLKDDCNELLKAFPLPEHNSIPVNALNFCKIDYHGGTLVTPSTVDSNNFDVYRISCDPFDISRLCHNVDGEKLSKTEPSLDFVEEVNPTKRDGFGIIMFTRFIDHQTFYIGYESGHVLGFKITYPSSKSIVKENSNLLINKDASVKVIYVNDSHCPNPIISMEYDGRLLVGSTNKFIHIHSVEQDDVKIVNVKHNGIQLIQSNGERYVVGFWNGMVRVYDKEFNCVGKHQVTLPALKNVTDTKASSHEITTSLKLSTLKIIVAKGDTKHKTRHNALIRQKNPQSLVMVGFNDGKLMVFALQ